MHTSKVWHINKFFFKFKINNLINLLLIKNEIYNEKKFI